MAKQSSPSDFDDTKAEALPDVACSRDLKHCDPRLVKRFAPLATEYEQMFPGRKLLITCTYRSCKEQNRLWRQGRLGDKGKIVTNCDGITSKSNHNKFPSRAVDICVMDGGKAVWDETFYYPIGPLSTKYGLEWGGYWTRFSDFPHIQLPDKEA